MVNKVREKKIFEAINDYITDNPDLDFVEYERLFNDILNDELGLIQNHFWNITHLACYNDLHAIKAAVTDYRVPTSQVLELIDYLNASGLAKTLRKVYWHNELELNWVAI